MNTFQSIILILTFVIMLVILIMLVIASIKISSLFKPIPKCKYSLPEDIDLKDYITPVWSPSVGLSDDTYDLKDSYGNKVGTIKLTLVTTDKTTGEFEGGLEDDNYTFTDSGTEYAFNFSQLLTDQNSRGIQSSLSSDGINKTPMTGIGTMFDATCEY